MQKRTLLHENLYGISKQSGGALDQRWTFKHNQQWTQSVEGSQSDLFNLSQFFEILLLLQESSYFSHDPCKMSRLKKKKFHLEEINENVLGHIYIIVTIIKLIGNCNIQNCFLYPNGSTDLT